jgi:hypothetical protein
MFFRGRDFDEFYPPADAVRDRFGRRSVQELIDIRAMKKI